MGASKTEISKPGKAIYLRVGIWYNKKNGEIHMSGKNGSRFLTRISGDRASARGHRSLFKALAKCLKDNGAPAPEIEANAQRS